MARGLMWLPLLFSFIALAWLGWREYRKVEAYQQWAEDFENSKYDLYAVLGYKDQAVTWGKPTSGQIIDLQTFPLDQVREIYVVVGDQRFGVDGDDLPEKGKVALLFDCGDRQIQVPFTQQDLTVKWGQYLQKKRQLSNF